MANNISRYLAVLVLSTAVQACGSVGLSSSASPRSKPVKSEANATVAAVDPTAKVQTVTVAGSKSAPGIPVTLAKAPGSEPLTAKVGGPAPDKSPSLTPANPGASAPLSVLFSNLVVDGSTLGLAVSGGVLMGSKQNGLWGHWAFSPLPFRGSASSNLPGRRGPEVFIPAIYVQRSNVYYLDDSVNPLRVSRDGGKTFSETRGTADGLRGLVVGTGLTTLDVIDGLKLGGPLMAGAGSTVMIATSEGLALSTDLGKTFSMKTAVDGLGSFVVASLAVDADTGVLYVGTDATDSEPGGIAVSRDGGRTFQNQIISARGPTALKSDYPSAIYAHGSTVIVALTCLNFARQGCTIQDPNNNTLHNSALFLSEDSGATYTRSRVLDGFGHVVPTDVIFGIINGPELLALAGNSILRSSDGGKTFFMGRDPPLGAASPRQSICWDGSNLLTLTSHDLRLGTSLTESNSLLSAYTSGVYDAKNVLLTK